jgi:hypothetical protein
MLYLDYFWTKQGTKVKPLWTANYPWYLQEKYKKYMKELLGTGVGAFAILETPFYGNTAEKLAVIQAELKKNPFYNNDTAAAFRYIYDKDLDQIKTDDKWWDPLGLLAGGNTAILENVQLKRDVSSYARQKKDDDKDGEWRGDDGDEKQSGSKRARRKKEPLTKTAQDAAEHAYNLLETRADNIANFIGARWKFLSEKSENAKCIQFNLGLDDVDVVHWNEELGREVYKPATGASSSVTVPDLSGSQIKRGKSSNDERDAERVIIGGTGLGTSSTSAASSGTDKARDEERSKKRPAQGKKSGGGSTESTGDGSGGSTHLKLVQNLDSSSLKTNIESVRSLAEDSLPLFSGVAEIPSSPTTISHSKFVSKTPMALAKASTAAESGGSSTSHTVSSNILTASASTAPAPAPTTPNDAFFRLWSQDFPLIVADDHNALLDPGLFTDFVAMTTSGYLTVESKLSAAGSAVSLTNDEWARRMAVSTGILGISAISVAGTIVSGKADITSLDITLHQLGMDLKFSTTKTGMVVRSQTDLDLNWDDCLYYYCRLSLGIKSARNSDTSSEYLRIYRLTSYVFESVIPNIIRSSDEE